MFGVAYFAPTICAGTQLGLMVALVARLIERSAVYFANVRFSVIQPDRRRLGELMTKTMLARSIRARQGEIYAVGPNAVYAKSILLAVGVRKPQTTN